MTARRDPGEFLDAIVDFLSDLPDDPKEVDDELREMGYDPEEVGRKTQELVNRLIQARKEKQGDAGEG